MKNKTPQEMVREFHEVFGLVIQNNDTILPKDEWENLVLLRQTLIREEWIEVNNELINFLRIDDDFALEDLAKELADLAYVVYGTAISFGIDLDAVITEVHESNMSKLDDDGKPIVREDGKILKSDNYKEPDIYKVLYGNNNER